MKGNDEGVGAGGKKAVCCHCMLEPPFGIMDSSSGIEGATGVGTSRFWGLMAPSVDSTGRRVGGWMKLTSFESISTISVEESSLRLLMPRES